MYDKDNKDLLRRIYPKLYQDIIRLKPDENIYELIKTKTGEATLKIKIKDDTLVLHSKYNPEKEAVSIAEENHNPKIENYIIWGLGFGYHVKQLMKLAPHANFYILEPNKNVFKLAVENISLASIIRNSKVKLYVSDNMLEIIKTLKVLLILPNIKIVIHRPSLRLMGEQLVEIKYLLEEFKVREKSMEEYSWELDENFKENIRSYNENIDILFNRFNNIPLWIVSAGPSLDKNMKDLAKIKDKGIILSVGRAVRPLLKAGITPDLIIVTDPSFEIYNMQLEDLEIDIPIIVLSTCGKSVMMNYKGYKLIALQEGYEMAEVYARKKQKKLVKTGGSVATTALDVAINMGCNPITFVGQDLAFTDLKTHSKDTFSEDINVTKHLRKIEGNYGGMVYTSKSLYSYLRWIENRISQKPNVTFINATEGGAKIRGTEILTLQETIKKYGYTDIPDELSLISMLK